MIDKKVDSDISIDGDGNEISNIINSNNITINMYPDGNTIQMSINGKITIRNLYEILLNQGGKIESVKFTFGQEDADILNISSEDFYNGVVSELHAKDLIEDGKTGGQMVLTPLGKSVGEWFYENRPKKYDQERSELIQKFLIHNKSAWASQSDGMSIPIISKYTTNIVKELEGDGFLTTRVNRGIMCHNDIHGNILRATTPYFEKTFNK